MTIKPTFWEHLTFADGAPIPVTSIRAGTSWDLANLDAGLTDFVQRTNRCSICGHRLGEIWYRFVAEARILKRGLRIETDNMLVEGPGGAAAFGRIAAGDHLECVVESMRHSPYTDFDLEELPALIIMGSNGGRAEGGTKRETIGEPPLYAWPVPLRKSLNKHTTAESLHQYDAPAPALAAFVDCSPNWFDPDDPIPAMLADAGSFGEFHTALLAHAEHEAYTSSPHRFSLHELESRICRIRPEQAGDRQYRWRRYESHVKALQRSHRKASS